MASRNNQKSIDVVYVLGTGSNWRNNELRFSLRALDKNLKGIRKIWIVGEKPEFLKNVNIIQHPDEFGPGHADQNIIRKVLRICQEKTLSENFLFINDDHLIMKPMTASELPPYYKLDLATCKDEYFQDNAWKGVLFRTRAILKKMGYSTLHFDCHVPIVFNKKMFPEVISRFPYEKDTGFTMKSLYGNVVHPDGIRLKGEKVTVFRPYVLPDIREIVKNRSFIAFNDDGLKPALKTWLYTNFPQPSKYEKTAAAGDPFFEIIAWVSSNQRDYAAGCRLFDKYGKSKKVKKYLSKKESDTRYQKLEHKLRELLNYY
jgi:hypothetical protein